MGRPKDPKKTSCRMKKFAHIPEDKPLTVKEHTFCMEYIKGKEGKEAAVIAGYSEKSAGTIAHDLINHKPNTRKFIVDKLASLHERLDFEAFDLVRRAGQIALTNVTEIMRLADGNLQIKNSDSWSEAGKAIVSGIEERINERGDKSIQIKTRDAVGALSLLFRHHGLLEQSRMAPQRLHPEAVRAIKAVKEEGVDPMEAALELELCGIPLPKTLEIMISKIKDEDTSDEGDMIIPTAKELEEKHKKRMAEIQEERDSFLPERQKQVREMKSEMEAEGKKAFNPEPDDSDA